MEIKHTAMRRSVLLLLCLLPAVSAFAGGTEEFSCQTEKKFSDGHLSLHSAAITVRNGRIVKLSTESVNIFDHEGQTYSCTLDTDDPAAKAAWSVSGYRTKLAMDMPLCGKAVIAITRVGASYVLDFKQSDRFCCGTAVDWPAAITVSSSSDECKVEAQIKVE